MIAGVILAGGRSSRMGGRNKALVELGGQTLLARLMARLAPQVHALAVNSNVGLDEVAGANPILPDRFAGFPGPLAGLHAGLCWADGVVGITHVATASVDTPFLPADFVSRLSEVGAGVAVARSEGRLHPTCALWPLSLRNTLGAFLEAGTSRRVLDFAEAAGYVAIDFPAVPFDPFFNVNTPEELARAESLLESAE
ncbi:molybdenum cofactor guanylyltransferase MobA [Mesorhizobium sp. J428]|uniref:molybdenum cofactor guanylyltransferase MobA n=1 Tax=Mesorhizobium sp. J428 TaxID=2898440 RepID=UPI00215147ED|nr:molybdenum cofactor guanylyltransferase MobA [Mesorhizobium sp. J428]MCR5859558.1 molybdenum cofactor guanylyltransferase [Mesorhizobium sp. J428]